MRKNKGITLIALIVTIIILLILTGITINFMLGDNGILNRAKNAGEMYEEQAAREKLEIALVDLGADKIVDNTYNENAYIDDKLTKQEMIVNGDIVIVDGWQFEIDRSVPKIATSMGKGQQNEQIQIVATSTTSSDYATATIHVIITYDEGIDSIFIVGQRVEVPESINGIYTVEKEVTENGNYIILVKDKEGNYKTETIMIVDITEDMDIWNKEDLENFREKVNIGRTFFGRVVRVMADINLEGNEQNQWVPIGDYNTNTALYFAGTFEGNNHTISNIYSNSNNNYQGLFGRNNGIIQNLGLVNGKIKGNYRVAGIVAQNIGTIQNCYTNISVEGDSYHIAGITGYNTGIILNCHNSGSISNQGIGIGGIAGKNEGNIKRCYNEGKITSNAYNVAGIVGYNLGDITMCYNTATITSYGKTEKGNSLAGGISGLNENATITQCYNIGTIIGTYSGVGGIVGSNSNAIIKNCYNTGNVTAGENQNKNAFAGGIIGQNMENYVSKIENCYQIGKISCTGTRKYPGGIIGHNPSGCYLINCYSLEQNIFGLSEGTISNCSVKTENELKDIVSMLGEVFVKDTKNINQGYPILKWQE